MTSQQLTVESSGDCWYPEAATGSERSLSTGSLGSSGLTSRRARPRAPGLTSTLTSSVEFQQRSVIEQVAKLIPDTRYLVLPKQDKEDEVARAQFDTLNLLSWSLAKTELSDCSCKIFYLAFRKPFLLHQQYLMHLINIFKHLQQSLIFLNSSVPQINLDNLRNPLQNLSCHINSLLLDL